MTVDFIPSLMNKISPTLSAAIIGLVAAVGVTFARDVVFNSGANLKLDSGAAIQFTTDNTVPVGTQSARASAIYSVFNSSARSSSTLAKIGDSSIVLDGFFYTSSTINVDAIVGGASAATSVTVALTGVRAGDICDLGLRGTWTGASSTVLSWCQAETTDLVRLFWRYTSTTASADLTPSTYDIFVQSVQSPSSY